MVYRQSRVVNGIFRIINIIWGVAFVIGEIVIYDSSTAIKPSTYIDVYGRTLYNDGRPFNVSGFIEWSFIWIAILVVAYFSVIYLINGFRSKSEVDGKS